MPATYCPVPLSTALCTRFTPRRTHLVTPKMPWPPTCIACVWLALLIFLCFLCAGPNSRSTFLPSNYACLMSCRFPCSSCILGTSKSFVRNSWEDTFSSIFLCFLCAGPNSHSAFLLSNYACLMSCRFPCSSCILGTSNSFVRNSWEDTFSSISSLTAKSSSSSS